MKDPGRSSRKHSHVSNGLCTEGKGEGGGEEGMQQLRHGARHQRLSERCTRQRLTIETASAKESRELGAVAHADFTKATH